MGAQDSSCGHLDSQLTPIAQVLGNRSKGLEFEFSQIKKLAEKGQQELGCLECFRAGTPSLFDFHLLNL